MDQETVSKLIREFTKKANEIPDPQFTASIIIVGYLGLFADQLCDIQKTLDQINEKLEGI